CTHRALPADIRPRAVEHSHVPSWKSQKISGENGSMMYKARRSVFTLWWCWHKLARFHAEVGPPSWWLCRWSVWHRCAETSHPGHRQVPSIPTTAERIESVGEYAVVSEVLASSMSRVLESLCSISSASSGVNHPIPGIKTGADSVFA